MNSYRVNSEEDKMWVVSADWRIVKTVSSIE
jgi:hypothetical protein